MKPPLLKHAQHLGAYRFRLTFIDGQVRESDLAALIDQHVSVNELVTVNVDSEWGCLAFLNGQVDIEPDTLARFVGLIPACYGLKPIQDLTEYDYCSNHL